MKACILITSAGSGPCNNLMRSLVHGETDSIVLMGCHSDRFVLKRSPAQRNFLLPSPGDGEGRSKLFGQALRSLVIRVGVDLIIPSNDRDAIDLARMHERTPLPCRTLLPASKTIALCQDKYALYLVLRDSGVPVPQTYPLTDAASATKAWRALAPRGLVWCRIRQGGASRGATKVRDVDQAWSWISYWHTMRNVPVEYFTLSEFLPGRDYNVQGILV